MLKDRGLKVALVEARRIGEEVTGKSTAKITSQHNHRLLTIIERKFGEDGARLYAEANEAGVRARSAELAARHEIDCDLETQARLHLHPGRGRGRPDRGRRSRRRGASACRPSLTRDTGLPFAVLAAMRWDDQAQFHPVKYVKGLAATLPGDGCHVFEHSRVIDWDPHRIATDGGSVRARHVVMATHLPLGQDRPVLRRELTRTCIR